MLAKIKKLTPPSQLRVCAPIAGVTPRSRALAKRLRDLGQTADILDLASGIGRVLFGSKTDP